ncbi:YbjN domain-containing protein [Schaalia sp. 19OD2882]|nr:YbjN domain-containing protein [Schaalia sp. 19OD2882]
MNTLHPVPEDTSTPWPADLDRAQRTLISLGVAADVLVPGRALGAVVEQVPFLVNIDASHRFLSVRAIWETDMDPAETSRWMIAAADSWNREKYFPTIYWLVSELATVQVCADFVVDTLAGISDEQLRENLRAGIATGISAIDYMKEAAHQTLELPVLKPRPTEPTSTSDKVSTAGGRPLSGEVPSAPHSAAPSAPHGARW